MCLLPGGSGSTGYMRMRTAKNIPSKRYMKLRSTGYRHLSKNALGVLAYVQCDPMSVKTITT